MERIYIPYNQSAILLVVTLIVILFISGCTQPVENKHICTDQEKAADVCMELAKPVCGFDATGKQVKTFSNSCFACIDAQVNYYTEDSCISADSCKYDDPEKTYQGKNQEECARTRFTCDTNTEYFLDGCGCGCKQKASSQIDTSDNLDDSLTELDELSE